jgi:integrase
VKYTAQRKIARPTIRVASGVWVADLRGAGLPQNRLVLGPEALSEVEALHRAWERVVSLRDDRLAEVKQQRDLFDCPAPTGFAAAVDAWKAQHRPRSGDAGALRYVASVARRVRRHLGGYSLEEFAPPAGNARLEAYVQQLIRRELAGRTVRNLLTCALQVLRFAVSRGWLRALPLRPQNLPPKAPPVYRWITEEQFRALRARIFAGATASELRRVEGVRDAGAAALYVERRRCWLSWVFYTGVHHYDADHATGGDLFMDAGRYVRRNHKSARCVRPRQFDMPPPLLDDLRALEVLQGHPIAPDEPFTGGPWDNGSRTIQAAARALGFRDGCTPSILRRSYARELLIREVTVEQTAELMGHADTRMLRDYAETVVPARGGASPWTRRPPSGAGMGRVLPMRGA